MEFSTLFFIFIFLPLSLGAYFLAPDIRMKNIVLLAISLLFYTFGQPMYLPLLAVAAYLNYYLAFNIRSGRKSTLVLPVVLNIFMLGLFKVCNQNSGWVFPIGISYYTFQMIAYQVDIYRGKHKPAERFTDFLLFVSMFPKLLTGPIVRYDEIRQQIQKRRSSPRRVLEGLFRFSVGLAKKVLIADYAFRIFESLQNNPSGAGTWLGAVLYMFYIYFEFSGVSDMAIGLAKVFGFRYPENFNLPYTSNSITEFWRRWHMTLGSFFKDYVYIPLGGNRKGKLRQVFNLFAVWALTGLWHGVTWTFVLWGLYFFVLLSVEKQLLPRLERWPYILRNLITMFFVLIGWVIFSSKELSVLGQKLAMMLGSGEFTNAAVGIIFRNSLPLLGLCVIGATPLPRYAGYIWTNLLGSAGKRDKFTVREVVYAISLVVVAAILIYLCTASLVGASSVPSQYAAN